MNEGQMLIQGGTLVTSHGAKKADLWIKAGKICRLREEKLLMHRNAQPHETSERIDASDYYILPGFIGMVHMQVNRMRSVSAYIQETRSYVAKGFTSIVDTIRLDDWMEGEQLLYQLTPHYNCSIDYAVQLAIDARQFTPQIVREMGRYGFQLIQVTVREEKEMDMIAWDALYPLIHQYRMSLQLQIPPECRRDRERAAITEKWLADCRYGKVRTRVADVDPFAVMEREPFYHLALVGQEQCGRLFSHLMEHWYDNIPAFASLDHLSLAGPVRQGPPEAWLSLVVRLASTNAAKAMGCYPLKGSLLPGAHADLLFLKKSDWLTKFDLSTILNGSEFCQFAWIMSNGRWIYRDGVHATHVGSGRHLRDLKPYNYVI
ncbi:amidohydrolase family protein [Brevibacillus sp. SYP-B805]|uniref:amidohydrolase family protein n=1 Tax=Brevibacillus sp. SYP-B805 TaxID=1578199 RepID=UPI0019D289A7